MKNANLDYSLIEQIDRHKKERKDAEWQAQVERAKRIGSLQAKIEFAALVVVVIMALILIPEPFPR